MRTLKYSKTTVQLLKSRIFLCFQTTFQFHSSYEKQCKNIYLIILQGPTLSTEVSFIKSVKSSRYSEFNENNVAL